MSLPLLGAGLSSPTAYTANDILTITDNGGSFCRVATGAAHGLSGSETINVSGNSEAAYNVEHVVGAIISPTVFDTTVEYVGNGTGGVWAAA